MFSSKAEIYNFVEADVNLKKLHQHVLNNMAFDSAHDEDHFFRVAFYTFQFLEDFIPSKLVIATSLLHDFVNPPKDSPLRSKASELSSHEAQKILPSFGFAPNEIDEVSLAIRQHSFSRGEKASTILSRAFQDADRIEALGAIGLARMFAVGGKLDRTLFHSRDPLAKNRPLNDKDFGMDHIQVKLLKIPEQLNTEAAKIEAAKRISFMKQFEDQITSELGIN